MATRVGVLHRVVDDVRVAVVALYIARFGDHGVGLYEAAYDGVVQAGVHIDQPGITDVFVSGKASYLAGTVVVVINNFQCFSEGGVALLLDDLSTFVGDGVDVSQCVTVHVGGGICLFVAVDQGFFMRGDQFVADVDVVTHASDLPVVFIGLQDDFVVVAEVVGSDALVGLFHPVVVTVVLIACGSSGGGDGACLVEGGPPVSLPGLCTN